TPLPAPMILPPAPAPLPPPPLGGESRGEADSVLSTQYSVPLPSPPRGEGEKTIPATSALSPERVQSVLLAVVSDKTGYPPEMLDPDMGLDADLGIDSIKRVEILSALQEQLPEAPAVKPEHLGTLHTLRQIAEFLCAPVGEPGASATGVLPPVADAPGSPAPLNRLVLRPAPLSAAGRSPVRVAAGAEVWLVGAT